MRTLLMGILLFCLATVGVCHAASLPRGTSFIGLRDGAWNVYVVREDAAIPQMVRTISEPRTATFSLGQAVVTYVAADGAIREVILADGKDRVLLEPDRKRAFVQPSYGPEGKGLLLVEMKDGSSADTEIALADTGKPGIAKPVTSQPGAQFEPRFGSGHLMVYSSVSCSIGCGNIIQEIWRKDLVTERAEQLTLLNAIARQPVVSVDGKWVYFSSNKAGCYHIWRAPMSGGNPEQFSRGDVSDVNPAVVRDNGVCFVRNVAAGSRIVCRMDDDAEQVMDVPAGVTHVRNLEISTW